MSKGQTKSQHILSAYNNLRAIAADSVGSASTERLLEAMWTSCPPEKRIDRNDARGVLHLALRVAQHCDFETFETFMETSEVPPIKLTKKELKILNGGKFPKWLKWVGIGLGAAVIGLGIKSHRDNNSIDHVLGQARKANDTANALTDKYEQDRHKLWEKYDRDVGAALDRSRDLLNKADGLIKKKYG